MGNGKSLTSRMAVQMPTIVQTAQQADALNDQNFSATDTQDYHDLHGGRAYYLNQTFDIDTRMALQDYVADQTEAGSIYSPSQNLNFRLNNDMALTANQEFMRDSLDAGMHNLGENLNLTAYQRIGFVERLGVKNYWNMTEAQLQKTLVGTTFDNKSYISTSYNDFRNAPASNPFTDKAVRIRYQADADVRALMPPRGNGGNLGEIVLGRGLHHEIVGVRFTGDTGRSGANTYPRIEFTIKVSRR